jgi:hypothetical protein
LEFGCVLAGGMGMIQAWALEQEGDSKRKFEDQNVLVPWKLQSKFATGRAGDNETEKVSGVPAQPLVYQRFCHVYCKGELEELLDR